MCATDDVRCKWRTRKLEIELGDLETESVDIIVCLFSIIELLVSRHLIEILGSISGWKAL